MTRDKSKTPEEIEELKNRQASSIRAGTNLRYGDKGFYPSCYNSQSGH